MRVDRETHAFVSVSVLITKMRVIANYSCYSYYLQENAEKYIKSCYYSQKYSLNFFIFISQI